MIAVKRIFPAIAILLLMLPYLSLHAQEINRTDESGKKQGNWKKLFSNGKVRYEGQFKDDVPYGLFKYYYEDGRMEATNRHVGDGTVAAHIYYPNGKIKAKGVFRNMKKDSLWQYFSDKEILRLEEWYASGKLNGPQKKYYDNEKIGEETNFDHGEKHGRWLKFYDNGNPWVEANYDKGDLDGVFKMYQSNGKFKITGSYNVGLRTGTWLMFNENGSIKTKDKYADGVLKDRQYQNGEFTEYYDDEITKSIYNYKSGLRSGEFKEYYDKGNYVEEKVAGKLGGPDEIEQHLEGTQLKMKGWYNNGKLNGKVKYYKEDGSVDRIEEWDNGKLVSTIDWKAEGNE